MESPIYFSSNCLQKIMNKIFKPSDEHCKNFGQTLTSEEKKNLFSLQTKILPFQEFHHSFNGLLLLLSASVSAFSMEINDYNINNPIDNIIYTANNSN